MQNFKKLGAIFSVLLIVIINTGCSVTNVREHPELEAQLLDIDTVLISTPVVSIEKVNLSGDNEQIKDQEDDIKAQLIDLANTHLQARGFEIVDFDINSAIEQDEELAYAVNQAREGFKHAKKTLYKETLSEDEKRKFKVSVGTAVNIVSEKSGADAILLMHYSGLKKSGGSVAKDIALGVLVGLLTGVAPVSSMEAAMVEFVFIDGATGEVLWSNIKNAEYIGIRVAEIALEDFPQDVDSKVEVSQTIINTKPL